jgi:ATP synthase protein I
MAQPLSPEPLPEAPERVLLQDPPERRTTGPRPRPGLRKRPVADETPLPARGAGMTITSYLIAGLMAYGLIGWLIGRAVHLEILTAVGMLIGLGISMALIIYRYGRSTPPRIYRFAPKPETKPETGPAAPDQANEQNGSTTTMREELTGDR